MSACKSKSLIYMVGTQQTILQNTMPSAKALPHVKKELRKQAGILKDRDSLRDFVML